MGLRSSVYPITITPKTGTVPVNTNLLTNDIEVTEENLAGESGLYRVYICIESVATSFELNLSRANPNVDSGNVRLMKLNADQAFEVNSLGYYRFDIGVRPEDKINFQLATSSVTKIREFHVDQIQIGA